MILKTDVPKTSKTGIALIEWGFKSRGERGILKVDDLTILSLGVKLKFR